MLVGSRDGRGVRTRATWHGPGGGMMETEASSRLRSTNTGMTGGEYPEIIARSGMRESKVIMGATRQVMTQRTTNILLSTKT